MVDEVLIHIGMHKTGSTSIQASIKDYNDGVSAYASLGDENHSVLIYTGFDANYQSYGYWSLPRPR